MTDNAVFIKDGSMGTQLEQWVNMRDVGPMWSSSVLLSDPSLVQRVHAAYISVGVDILSTCTYQMFAKGTAEANVTMPELVDRAVRAAAKSLEQGKCAGIPARTKLCGALFTLSAAKKRPVLLAGSLGPFGASIPGGHEYAGDYKVSEDDIASFHGERLAAFVNGDELKVDFMLLETFPRLDEVIGICAWINRQSRVLRHMPICFSFVSGAVSPLFHSSGSETELNDWWQSTAATVGLPDGQTFGKVLNELRFHRPAGLIGIGCNCSSPLEVCLVFSRLLEEKKLNEAEESLALLIAPNSGEVYTDGKWKNNASRDNEDMDEAMPALQRRLAEGNGDIYSCAKYCLRLFKSRPEASDWLFDSVICGACCRSTPYDIAAIKSIT